jgi:hypothetical protein
MVASIQNAKKVGRDCCHRCSGLMVPEYETATGIEEWRCVSCGERVDPVILRHRALRDARSEAEALFAEAGPKNFN